MSLLASYHDPTLPVSAEDTRVTLTAAETARLLRQSSVMYAITTMPRRLGSDASDDDLATDKKRARRTQHALFQCLQDWVGKRVPKLLTTPEIRQEATQVNWTAWIEEHERYVRQRTVYIASWAIKIDNDKDKRWAKSAVVRLQNESRWVAYALR
jgi:hypothetical protein